MRGLFAFFAFSGRLGRRAFLGRLAAVLAAAALTGAALLAAAGATQSEGLWRATPAALAPFGLAALALVVRRARDRGGPLWRLGLWLAGPPLLVAAGLRAGAPWGGAPILAGAALGLWAAGELALGRSRQARGAVRAARPGSAPRR